MGKLRSWATPLTIGTFLIMSLTGVLMFFHADSGANKILHEWVGLGMVSAVGLHLVLNWRAFSLYFKRPLALGLMGVAAVTLAGSFLIASGGPGGPRPDMAGAGLTDAIISAPLDLVGPVLGTDGTHLVTALNSAGFTAEPGQSIADIAAGDVAAQMQLVSLLTDIAAEPEIATN